MDESIRILYLLIFLISGALVTQAQVTLPEQVCVGLLTLSGQRTLTGPALNIKVAHS